MTQVWPVTTGVVGRPLIPTFRGPARQRGTVSLEAALLVPLLVLIVSCGAAGWRVWWAQTQMHAAVEAGARSASLMSDVALADQAVQSVVSGDLAMAGIACRAVVISTDVSAVALPAGVSGQVRVDVSCTVGLADLLVPGLPGSVEIRSSAVEAVDLFRKR